MKTKIHSSVSSPVFVLSAACAIVVVLFARPAAACGGYGFDLTLFQLTRQAVSTNEAGAGRAITALRERGPAGLDALFTAHAKEIRSLQYALFPAAHGTDQTSARLVKAIEAVSRQRDGVTSRLYWFTDIEQAKAAAKTDGKPILSLRLLGRLDEEFSCANSRFFRTALYANADLSQYLREHFVLHWESVRPVPRITIDFGDGRKLERTITGNSIHYVLDADGRPIDALPGLYGPKAFRAGLERAAEAAKQYASRPTGEHAEFLREYHRARAAAVAADWNRDLARVGAVSALPKEPKAWTTDGFDPLRQNLPFITPQTTAFTPVVNLRGTFRPEAARPTNVPPTAAAASRVAYGKTALELPMLRSLSPRSALDLNSLEAATSDGLWAKLAALHLDDAKLDAASQRLMFRKLDARQAGHLADSKALIEGPLLRLAAPFERSMSEDTVRNEYLLHTKIHQWFAADAPQTRAVAALNDSVLYAELFLTPGSDPWLGLKPADAYSALEGDGVVATTGK